MKRKMMTDEELKTLAFKYLDGRVITSQQVPQDLWLQVFMPLFFMKDPGKVLRGARMVYAITGEDKASHLGVNGWPMFLGCRLMNAGELKKFVAYVAEARELRDAFVKKKK